MVVVKQWIETGYVWKDRARWVQLRSRFSGDGYLLSSIQRWHNRFHDFRPDSLPSSSSSSSSIFYCKRVSEDIDAEKESVLTRMHQAVAVPVIGNVCHVFMHGLNHVQGMDMAITKLNRDEWVHIFLEGSRSRDGGKTMGSPKRGIGRKKLGFEMKALRAVRALNSAMVSPKPKQKTHSNSIIWKRFYVAQPQEEDGHQTSTSISSSEDDEGFDSSHYEMDGNHVNNVFEAGRSKTWDEKYRERVKSKVFGEETKSSTILEKEVEKRKRAAVLARALLEASVVDQESKGEDKEVVREEDQMSLSVGIIGAPNAGKSALTNYMVGTKVAAVSRKTNTTTHEVLGVMTKGHTQICFFDTPGLMLKKSGFPYNDMKVRVESAWGSVSLYDVLIVIFDVNRHLTRSDSRVVRLIERMGSQVNTTQKRILCMNKVDLVEKKKDLLKVVEEFKDLPGFERHFMISGLKGWGVMDLTQYLMQQAVKRPWDEDPFTMSEEVMKNISLEVVREKLLEYIHQEIPYNIEHRLMDWKELRDGSLRIEQHFITPKMSQRKILVGKKGSKIGRIGVEANEELRSIFKRNVHLILMVRVK